MTQEEKKQLMDIFSHKSMYGNVIMTSDIVLNDEPVFGDKKNHTLEFEIWDGMAYCFDHEGHEYIMTYPKKSIINLSTDMSNAIRQHLELSDDDKIEVVHILMTYNKLSKVR